VLKVKYSRHSSEPRNDLFATLTFSRDVTRGATLRKLRTNLGKFTRQIRKDFGAIEYLRSIEEHKDNFPHIHLHILFRNYQYTPERGRYLPETMYKTLKSSWTHGHTDYQPPRGKGYGVVRYTLKYLNKTTSSNNLWSQLLTNVSPVENTSNVTSEQPTSAQNVPSQENTNPVIYEDPFLYYLHPTSTSLTHSILKPRRVKKVYWTRGYVEMLKSMI
jgi:CRISPR/Cas system CSM-associated protein Csm2 small subunit